ncbi:hypothetical protein OH76DRAFT_686942 [Lentinus brumalis]|uniref:Uncharacterized protein n=1 Tax=Lentinus brumalis TaxID=2498619 RepID=A0A371CH28_9APHY|nr:hypothetical protein OH76DRAFT_686942 [Polyporus brumalis]
MSFACRGIERPAEICKFGVWHRRRSESRRATKYAGHRGHTGGGLRTHNVAYLCRINLCRRHPGWLNGRHDEQVMSTLWIPASLHPDNTLIRAFDIWKDTLQTRMRPRHLESESRNRDRMPEALPTSDRVAALIAGRDIENNAGSEERSPARAPQGSIARSSMLQCGMSRKRYLLQV